MTSGAGEDQDAVLAWLGGQGEGMRRLLADIVDLDSGSGDRAGINAVSDRLASFLRENAVDIEQLSLESGERILRADVAGQPGRSTALLMGHMDTVFPSGTAAKRPFHEDGGRFYGPGVADMKSGLVAQCFNLAAFARAGQGRCPLMALFTTDEEVASPLGRSLIIEAARSADYALNAEPGRRSGNVVVERKGGLFLRVLARGKAAHSGVDFESGASAIIAIARKIEALHAMGDPAAGVTVNVGLVSGGRSINTVADAAEIKVDIRYRRAEERDALLAAVAAVVARDDLPGTAAEWRLLGEFQPMAPTPQSRELFETYRAAARAIGFDVAGEATGGCSDAGFPASLGLPTLCGLGPVGGGAHTDDEFVEASTMIPRAQALALTIMRRAAEPARPRA
jgi:glutamate carboxypeptidase